MDVNTTYDKIKRLKIQGAEAIATAGIKAIRTSINSSKAQSKFRLTLETQKAVNKIVSARETEPQLENYLYYILDKIKESKAENINSLKKEISQEVTDLLKHKKQIKKEIIKNGLPLIKNNDIVFTHCHSSSVTSILKEAKNKRKKFEVYNTETRPKFQGRKTAIELAKAKIKVTHFVDSGARIALKESDIMFIGADSITHNKIYNKIGSEMMTLVAYDYKVPVYVCASLWKFNKHRETIENRSTKEVWERPPKGIKVKNYAFEKIAFKYVKGIICEAGILKPKQFIKKARQILD